jgi:hypothetical protein
MIRRRAFITRFGCIVERVPEEPAVSEFRGFDRPSCAPPHGPSMGEIDEAVVVCPTGRYGRAQAEPSPVRKARTGRFGRAILPR